MNESVLKDQIFMYERCVELWLWCAENPQETKNVWPGWDRPLIEWPSTYQCFNKFGIRNSCFLCEFHDMSCKECCLSDSHSSCDKPGGVFWRYCKGGYDERTKAALEIVERCKKVLAELREKTKPQYRVWIQVEENVDETYHDVDVFNLPYPASGWLTGDKAADDAAALAKKLYGIAKILNRSER